MRPFPKALPTISNSEATLGFTTATVNITGPFLSSGSTYYFVFDLTGTKIFPGDNSNGGGSQPFKEVRFTITSTGTWNPSNDWSFTGLNATSAKTTYIPVYSAGLKVFGNQAP